MNLAGSFRVSDREVGAMIGMRKHLRLSMNQIARVLNRSTSTVHNYVQFMAVNNRRNQFRVRVYNSSRFNYLISQIRVKVKMYLQGLFATIKEALYCKSIPMAALDFLTENTSDEEEEDPA